MKKLFKNAAMLFMVASTIGLLSCSDNDDPPPSNCGTLEVDGAKIKLTSAFIGDFGVTGQMQGTFFYLLSEGLTAQGNKITGTGKSVGFMAISEAGKSINGTYTSYVGSNEDAPTVGQFHMAIYSVIEADENDGGSPLVKGNIKIIKISADIYEISGDTADANGKKIKFYYKGKITAVEVG